MSPMSLKAQMVGDREALPGAVRCAVPHALTSPWEPGRTPASGSVRLAGCPDALMVRAELSDDEVFTNATRDSEYFWLLGDVFEMFLEAEGAGFYTEMHVAPGSLRLHLKIRHEDYAAMVAEALTPSDLIVSPPGFESRCELIPGGWAAEALIPVELVDPKGVLSPDSRWQASFCRYNAWKDGRPPELTSTSPYRSPVNFHSRTDWRPLCF